MENLYKVIHTLPDEAIVVILDGDDWFKDDQVFLYLDELYTNKNIWLTAGGYVEYPSGKAGFCRSVPDRIIKRNAFRTYPRTCSQLRTFYAGLFKHIKLEDLFFKGNFFERASDIAKMMPMFEMASERIAFNQKEVYVYNLANSINDHKVAPKVQTNMSDYINKRDPYIRIQSFLPSPSSAAEKATIAVMLFIDTPKDLMNYFSRAKNLSDYQSIQIFLNNFKDYKNGYMPLLTQYKSCKITPCKKEYIYSFLETNSATHLCLIHNTKYLHKNIELKKHLISLEKTGALSWSLCNKKHLHNVFYKEIDPKNYAIQCYKKNMVDDFFNFMNFTLYRKKDIYKVVINNSFNNFKEFKKTLKTIDIKPMSIALYSFVEEL